MPRSFQRRRTVRPRSKTSWEQQSIVATHTAAASVTIADFTPAATDEAVLEGTLLRGILHFDLTATLFSAPEQFVSIGLAVVTFDAFAAGALPDPESDFNFDWYYWTRRLIKRETSTAGNNELVSWDVDLKTGPRLKSEMRLVLISQNPAQELVLTLHTSARLLWRKGNN